MLSQNIDLFFEILYVSAELFLFGCVYDIATAKITSTAAKWKMYIDRYLIFAISQIINIAIILKVITKLQSSRITGISRAWLGVFTEFV